MNCDNFCSLFPVPVLMQSLMGETTAVAHGGDPQDRAASPRPRCIATPYSLFPDPLFPVPFGIFFSLLPTPYSLFPIPYSLFPIPYSLFSTGKA
ncbi:MAG: hypothetical protein F6K26_50910 [Moorea sp. SIO2I5]|nr:hypothetical protein [Moorena sp. SIO2I5]